MRTLVRAGLAALAILAVAAGVASAGTIYAGPPSQFIGGDITVAQGEKVTFTNGDTMAHDVTASTKGADGKPLFASAQIGAGQSAPVEGVEYLTTGAYEYICSIHPFMKATITVSSEGTPAPRPGGGGSPAPGPSSPSTADTAAPSISLKLLDRKRSAVARRKALQVSVKSNEDATVTVTARSGKTTFATGSGKPGKLSLKLTKAGLKAARGSKAVRLSLIAKAKDAAGNASSATASGKLG
jgi:plastocyanin